MRSMSSGDMFWIDWAMSLKKAFIICWRSESTSSWYFWAASGFMNS